MSDLDEARARYQRAATRWLAHVVECRSKGECPHEPYREYVASRDACQQLERAALDELTSGAGIRAAAAADRTEAQSVASLGG